jgi:hypothetical protein
VLNGPALFSYPRICLSDGLTRLVGLGGLVAVVGKPASQDGLSASVFADQDFAGTNSLEG